MPDVTAGNEKLSDFIAFFWKFSHQYTYFDRSTCQMLPDYKLLKVLRFD